MRTLKLSDGTEFEYDDTPTIEFRKQYKIDQECCPNVEVKIMGQLLQDM